MVAGPDPEMPGAIRMVGPAVTVTVLSGVTLPTVPINTMPVEVEAVSPKPAEAPFKVFENVTPETEEESVRLAFISTSFWKRMEFPAVTDPFRTVCPGVPTDRLNRDLVAPTVEPKVKKPVAP